MKDNFFIDILLFPFKKHEKHEKNKKNKKNKKIKKNDKQHLLIVEDSN